MIKSRPVKWKKTGLGSFFKSMGKRHGKLLG